MTPREECWLALSLVKGLGQKSIRGLFDHFGGVEAILAASPKALGSVARIPPELAARISKAREVQAFQMEQRLVEQHGIRLTTLDAEDYPPLLLETDIPPPLLYSKGEFPLAGGLFLAVVGTRRYSRYGEKATRRLIEELATLEPSLVVVSGLARGIDTVAHEQALACGLKTIAVMAGGLTRIYPPENQGLAERVIGQGAVISEFPMTAPPVGKNFPIRNRIISGLSWGILVTEAGEKSGALITCGFGLHHNREVFAVPGNIDLPTFQGTNRLIQRGQAKLVREAADILEESRAFRRVGAEQLLLLRESPAGAAAGGGQLGGDKLRVVEVLRGGPLHPDDLCREADLPMEKLLSILLELELAGDIYQTPENQYAVS
jgi:DNA processing protein